MMQDDNLEKSEMNYKKKKKRNYNNLDPNKIVDAYGPCGRYQLFGYILCQLLNFTYASSIYVMSYIQFNPQILCFDSTTNEKIEVDNSCWIVNKFQKNQQCGIDNKTTLSFIDSLPVSSLVLEFGLTCQHYFWKEASIIFFAIGAVVTVPFSSALADRIGRRPVLIISLTITFTVNIIATMSPNLVFFLTCRFIIGAASDTYYSVVSILTCELISSKSRAWISLVYTLAWSTGMFYVGILSLFVKQWRWMYFINSLPGLLFIVYVYWIPESPHWLVLKKKEEEIENYITTSNKWNKTAINLDDCANINMMNTEFTEGPGTMLKNSIMRKYLCINGFIQFSLALYYFGISFMSVDLTDDRFTAFMVSAFVEIPGGLIVIPLMLYFGRRVVLKTSLFFQGILIAMAPFVTGIQPTWMPTVLLLAGKFINSISYAIHPIYVSELMPTSVRSSAFSIINVPQSLGIIMAPLFKHIGTSADLLWMKYVVVGLLCCSGSFMLMFLPETKDCNMLPDIESLGGVSEDEQLTTVSGSNISSENNYFTQSFTSQQ